MSRDLDQGIMEGREALAVAILSELNAFKPGLRDRLADGVDIHAVERGVDLLSTHLRSWLGADPGAIQNGSPNYSMRWEWKEITVATDSRETWPFACWVYGGLAVHKAGRFELKEEDDWRNGGDVNISQVSTGFRLASVDSLLRAARIVERLAAAVDWSEGYYKKATEQQKQAGKALHRLLLEIR